MKQELLYEIVDGTVGITGVKGENTHWEIPAEIEGYPVTVIKKKAFLGNKSVKSISLPTSIKELEDWAFAHCSNLETITLPRKPIYMGKGVCKDCIKLDKILLTQEPSKEDHMIGRLLAAVPVLMEAEYLFDAAHAGTEEWLKKWDSRMITLLKRKDESGFTKMVLCGEEDLLANLPDYVAEKQRSKARICFLRLQNNIQLSIENTEKLGKYLLEHTKGCQSEAAWEVVLKEHGDEWSYYQTLIDADAINQDNLPGMLLDMGENHAEMKAYLLRYREENLMKQDFFHQLSL